MNTGRHAFLILAHDQFPLLAALMCQLDDPAHDLYIHIDRKAGRFEEAPYRARCRYARVTFIERMRVYWGDESMVECELRLIEAALRSGNEYAWVHLLSGRDLCLKPNRLMHEWFDAHPKTQFIAFRKTASGIGGVNRYHRYMKLRYYCKALAKGLDLLSAGIQKGCSVDRLKDWPITPYKCQQWFSLTGECAAYVASQRDLIMRLMHRTCCGDEMFLASVIMDSRFAGQVYRAKDEFGHLRLIDRERNEGASPHTWTAADLPRLRENDCFWARKFDLEKDADVVEAVLKMKEGGNPGII